MGFLVEDECPRELVRVEGCRIERSGCSKTTRVASNDALEETVAECADVRASTTGAPQELECVERCPLGTILFLDAIPAAFLTNMFAQQ